MQTAALVDADRLQVVLESACKCRLGPIGQKDRLPIGAEQRPELRPRLQLRHAGELPAQILYVHLPDIGNCTFAKRGKLLLCDCNSLTVIHHISLLDGGPSIDQPARVPFGSGASVGLLRRTLVSHRNVYSLYKIGRASCRERAYVR